MARRQNQNRFTEFDRTNGRHAFRWRNTGVRVGRKKVGRSGFKHGLTLVVALAGVSFFSYQHFNFLAPQCRIKANISANGRIYHLPGQQYYSATNVNPLMGERWFCSEADARAAGWRRARL